MHKYTGRALLAIVIAAFFTAGGCSSNDSDKTVNSSSGGASSSSSSSSSGGTIIKGLGNIQVHYPPTHSSTEAEQIEIRGIVENPAQAASVYVNDVPVMSDDNLATWSLTVPLMPGSNALVVTSEDAAGTLTEIDTLTVERSANLISPGASVFDPASGNVYLLDVATQSITRLDVETGTLSPLSPTPSATENLLTDARGLILDKTNNRLLVFQAEVEEEVEEDGTDAPAEEEDLTDIDDFDGSDGSTVANPFIAVDLTTGMQTVFSYTTPNDSTLANSPRALTIDQGLAYVADIELVYVDSDLNRVPPGADNAAFARAYGVINTLDLSTGEMQILSGYGIPDNELPISSNLFSLTTAPESEFLYALEASANFTRIIEINKETGARALLTTDGTIEGSDSVITLTNPSALTLDYLNQRLLLQSSRRVLEIQLETGKITVLSATGVPAESPYPLIKFQSIALDELSNTLYVADDALDAVYAIDGETGLRSWISGAGGEEPDVSQLFSTPACVALAPQEQMAVVCDSLTGTAYRYDILAGQKTVLASDKDVPEGETAKITYPLSAASRTDADAYLVLDNFNQRPGARATTSAPRLLSIDDVTGEIDIIHSFNDPRALLSDLLYDPTRDVAYVADRRNIENSRGEVFFGNRIIELRFSNDEVTARVLHEASNSDDYRFKGLKSIDMDYPHNRILALDSIVNAVIAVDPDTGARTPLSTMTIPANGGPSFRTPQALVVDSVHNRALVLDSTLDAIIAIDLDTGQREIAFQSNDGDPNRLLNGKDLALHPFGYVLVVDDVKDTLIAIDLETSQVVTLTR